MRLFKCNACGNVVYFENHTCEHCHHRLAYIPELSAVRALEPAGDGRWVTLNERKRPRHLCANAEHDACNWIATDTSKDLFCAACRHNGIIPDLSQKSNLDAWRLIEIAKHRLVYGLLRWSLPLRTQAEDSKHGLVFNFLADPPTGKGPKVMTGHDNGVITVALIEANDAEREKRRGQMGEPYRTLLGHFRHEIGHYYWDILVRDGDELDGCRAVFGDDSQDYANSLTRYYDKGTFEGWQDNFVSAYATSHPWEDFAETWAHYLHIVDTLEMAHSFGMTISPHLDTSGTHEASIDFNPYTSGSTEQIMKAWIPFVFAMNSVNRAMGHGDLYPFVLAPAVQRKLAYIHDLIHGQPQVSSIRNLNMDMVVMPGGAAALKSE